MAKKTKSITIVILSEVKNLLRPFARKKEYLAQGDRRRIVI